MAVAPAASAGSACGAFIVRHIAHSRCTTLSGRVTDSGIGRLAVESSSRIMTAVRSPLSSMGLATGGTRCGGPNGPRRLTLVGMSSKASSLVGTDLTQAIPLVGAAALGHLLFGSFSFGITASLLLGAIPGAFLGAQVSSRAPGGVIRRALAVLLLASGLRLLGVSTEMVLVVAGLALVVGSLAWIVIRRTVRGPRFT